MVFAAPGAELNDLERERLHAAVAEGLDPTEAPEEDPLGAWLPPKKSVWARFAPSLGAAALLLVAVIAGLTVNGGGAGNDDSGGQASRQPPSSSKKDQAVAVESRRAPYRSPRAQEPELDSEAPGAPDSPAAEPKRPSDDLSGFSGAPAQVHTSRPGTEGQEERGLPK